MINVSDFEEVIGVFRYSEREMIKKDVKLSSEFLTDGEIEALLDDHNNYADYTIVFYKNKEGTTSSKTYDNRTGLEVYLKNYPYGYTDFYLLCLLHLINKDNKISKRGIA